MCFAPPFVSIINNITLFKATTAFLQRMCFTQNLPMANFRMPQNLFHKFRVYTTKSGRYCSRKIMKNIHFPYFTFVLKQRINPVSAYAWDSHRLL